MAMAGAGPGTRAGTDNKPGRGARTGTREREHGETTALGLQRLSATSGSRRACREVWRGEWRARGTTGHAVPRKSGARKACREVWRSEWRARSTPGAVVPLKGGGRGACWEVWRSGLGWLRAGALDPVAGGGVAGRDAPTEADAAGAEAGRYRGVRERPEGAGGARRAGRGGLGPSPALTGPFTRRAAGSSGTRRRRRRAARRRRRSERWARNTRAASSLSMTASGTSRSPRPAAAPRTSAPSSSDGGCPGTPPAPSELSHFLVNVSVNAPWPSVLF